MPRRPKVGREIRAKVSVDLSKFKKALAELDTATGERIVKAALLAGGATVQKAAISRAPGPHIVVELMSGKALGSGSGTGLMKKDIRAAGSYVVIGPDKAHWYYRFSELGTKDHGIKKRKSTTRQQDLRRQGRGKEARALRGKVRPAMKFTVNGSTVFARKVRGFAAKPFMEPAASGAGEAAMRTITNVIVQEIEKVRT
jgi:hypothetical protein